MTQQKLSSSQKVEEVLKLCQLLFHTEEIGTTTKTKICLAAIAAKKTNDFSELISILKQLKFASSCKEEINEVMQKIKEDDVL